MKGYMESGEFRRGRESIRGTGGIVLLGNFDVDVQHQQRVGHLFGPTTRTQVVDPSGTTTYTYDALQRLTAVTYPGPLTDSYTYDAVSNRRPRTAPPTPEPALSPAEGTTPTSSPRPEV